ncbi:hypothetical protein PPL_01396 [Heterostelium album PN500]|uniref:IPT/TIG domain-containing protein n=1 Tax=Heterostelium pallidum (strain ATCC 26659 / Pp 5 / PN500) TaxID=670386 RepID=D3AZ56_HETP5|nr:hypothetical protein PPL_01396 [Heterostelium album PN500]EFA85439.1 hypothetical protein PPL_01396 [Heterostelium album PN500]|eukprot:XP_020437548.1 hypothetical protein PPL_01396 [Heterostelium album PN500]
MNDKLVFTTDGTGVDKTVIVQVGDQVSNHDITISYKAPTITSISIKDPVPTLGGGALEVVGTSFGSDSDQFEINIGDGSCEDIVLISDTKASCTIPSGSGRLLVTVQVDSQQTELSQDFAIIYKGPNILQLVHPEFNTSIYNDFWIAGTDFGSEEDIPMISLYGFAAAECEYDFENCYKSKEYFDTNGNSIDPPTQQYIDGAEYDPYIDLSDSFRTTVDFYCIKCLLPPGFGDNISVAVVNDLTYGWTFLDHTLTFPNSKIYSIEPLNSSTDGNTTISITGTNFVPNEYIVYSYDNDTDTYVDDALLEGPITFSNITLDKTLTTNNNFTNSTFITTVIPAGIGKNLNISISLGNVVDIDTFNKKSFTFSYNPPNVTKKIVNQPTKGGLFSIEGLDFVPEILAKSQQTFPNSNVTIDGKLCTSLLWINSTLINCTVVEGIGANLTLEVFVGNQSSISDGKSSIKLFSYIAPNVTSEELSGTSKGNVEITIKGTNFVPASVVTSATNDKTNNYISINGNQCLSTKWENDQTSYCTIPPGIGTDLNVLVVVGNQKSPNNAVFSYDRPILEKDLYYSGPNEGQYEITIKGSNFVPSEIADKVTKSESNTIKINDVECPSIRWSTSSICYCTIPQGSGHNLTVNVTVGGQWTSTNDYFSYYDIPEISSIQPLSDVDGTEPITITGKFFYGKDLKVLFEEKALDSSKILSISETKIIFTCPSGGGTKFKVQVKAHSQESETFTYDGYKAPSNLQVRPSSGKTDESQPIDISGNNLGLLGEKVKVTIDGKNCINPVVSSSSLVTCYTPFGSEGTKTLTLTFKGQSGDSQYTYEEEEESSDHQSDDDETDGDDDPSDTTDSGESWWDKLKNVWQVVVTVVVTVVVAVAVAIEMLATEAVAATFALAEITIQTAEGLTFVIENVAAEVTTFVIEELAQPLSAELLGVLETTEVLVTENAFFANIKLLVTLLFVGGGTATGVAAGFTGKYVGIGKTTTDTTYPYMTGLLVDPSIQQKFSDFKSILIQLNITQNDGTIKTRYYTPEVGGVNMPVEGDTILTIITKSSQFRPMINNIKYKFSDYPPYTKNIAESFGLLRSDYISDERAIFYDNNGARLTLPIGVYQSDFLSNIGWINSRISSITTIWNLTISVWTSNSVTQYYGPITYGTPMTLPSNIIKLEIFLNSTVTNVKKLEIESPTIGTQITINNAYPTMKSLNIFLDDQLVNCVINAKILKCPISAGIQNKTLSLRWNNYDVYQKYNIFYTAPVITSHIENLDIQQNGLPNIGSLIFHLKGTNFIPNNVNPLNSKVLISGEPCQFTKWVDENNIICLSSINSSATLNSFIELTIGSTTSKPYTFNYISPICVGDTINGETTLASGTHLALSQPFTSIFSPSNCYSEINYVNSSLIVTQVSWFGNLTTTPESLTTIDNITISSPSCKWNLTFVDSQSQTLKLGKGHYDEAYLQSIGWSNRIVSFDVIVGCRVTVSKTAPTNSAFSISTHSNITQETMPTQLLSQITTIEISDWNLDNVDFGVTTYTNQWINFYGIDQSKL